MTPKQCSGCGGFCGGVTYCRYGENGPIERPGVWVEQEVIDFLHGVGPLDGKHFGEVEEREIGGAIRKSQYWWRRFLPPYSKAAAREEEI